VVRSSRGRVAGARAGAEIASGVAARVTWQ
jgi:hypothetical protein